VLVKVAADFVADDPIRRDCLFGSKGRFELLYGVWRQPIGRHQHVESVHALRSHRIDIASDEAIIGADQVGDHPRLQDARRV
jgi:hypothetical protein